MQSPQDTGKIGVWREGVNSLQEPGIRLRIRYRQGHIDPVAMNDIEELIPTRRTLLSRLKDWNDQQSWKEFFDTYWKLIYQTAIKAGLTDAEAQDVVQETVISVCKKMPEFKYRAEAGSFKSWLLQLTNWRIVDQLRHRSKENLVRSQLRGGMSSETPTVERVPDPHRSALEAIWEEEWTRNLMDAAIGRVKHRVDNRQYQLFDLCVLKQWPVNKITRLLRVRAGQVYLAKHRVSALVRKEVKRLESQHF